MPAAALAQTYADPATSSRRQALRVLLGNGDAVPVSSNTFSFAGKLYRGSFARSGGQVVNLVDLESYLYSVVSREMPSGWPASALQAQAVCARTYVLQRSDPRRFYDLVPSELDQRYDGIEGETPPGNAAVDVTAGRVLSYGGGFAQIAYSSCCGGHTESSADAWGNTPLPYLSGVVCTSCVDSPNYRWNRAIDFTAVAAAMASSVPAASRINDVRVGARDASGRARDFEVFTDQGSTQIGGSAFRRAVGTRVLPSLLVTSLQRAPSGDTLAAEGGGLGHGVGLCQWGARGMAQSGGTAPQIVAHYFPGTVLEDLN
jgi:stage II sporulation protein D